MEDGVSDGLSARMGTQVISLMAEMDLDAIEISGGVRAKSVRKGIRNVSKEAYFLPLVQLAREGTDLPLIIVGGMRSKGVMEDVLSSGDADFIAMCRPLINDPNFPDLMRTGMQATSGCISSSNCWAESLGEGIACKCPPLKT